MRSGVVVIGALYALGLGGFAAPVLADTAEDGAVPAASATAPSGTTWPLRFVADDVTYTMYYPQFDEWQDDHLRARAAVGAQSGAAARPDYGEISLTARTTVDSGSRRVIIRDIAITKVRFPTATAREQAFLAAFREQLPDDGWSVPLDRLQADVDIDNARRLFRVRPTHDEAPRIVYRDQPALLVPVDGEPALREIDGTSYSRVINTRAFLVLDRATNRYSLAVAKTWFEAPAIDGPWGRVAAAPAGLEGLRDEAAATGRVDLLERPQNGRNGLPEIVVSTVPTELIQTDGPPQYAAIPNTRLSYVTNSPNQLFLDARNRRHYVLLSGRWFQSDSLRDGPWRWLPGESLPADFAAIPPDSPVAGVRASVPGTPQAEEAVIATNVPQVATVKRNAATLDITYDGEPRFEPIAGTRLQSAVNAPMPVIRVDTNDFYALDNGVWFVASNPAGPWSVATYVPPVIYTIPPSSPLHYVTYVRLYGSGDDAVATGYTSGYVGSYVAGSTVVYGTGWRYRPWIGTVWYGPPVTWGFGFGWCDTWWSPWGPPFYYPPPYWGFRPWWGPWGSRVIVTRVAPAAPVPQQFVANRTTITNVYNRWGSAAAPHPLSITAGPSRSSAPASLPTIVRGDATAPRAWSGGSSMPPSRSQWITVPPSAQRAAPPMAGPAPGAASARPSPAWHDNPGRPMNFEHRAMPAPAVGDRFEGRTFGNNAGGPGFAPARNVAIAQAPAHSGPGHGFHGGGGGRRR